jgi:hypothetical protein
MILNDKINVRGEFLIKTYKADGSVEEYAEKNLIMDKARSNMAELVSGWGLGAPMTRFLIGTKGHNPDTNNVLEPIQVGANNFVTTRTNIFSQEQGTFYYTLIWDPLNPVDSNFNTPVSWTETGVLTAYAKGNKYNQTGIEDGAENVACPLRVEVLDRTIKYTFTIPEIAANGDDGQSVVAFTEAALMSGDDIFSMKTFPARVKENTVKFEIVWSIIF